MNPESNFVRSIGRMWWVPLLTGLIAIGLGIWSLCSPIESMAVFAYTFAAIMLIAGVLNLVYAFSSRAVNWGWTFVLGLLEVAGAVLLFTMTPGEIGPAFAWCVGLWLIFACIFSMCDAISVSGGRSAGWVALCIIMLVLVIIFGFMFLFNPIVTMEAGWLYLGISLIVFGIFRLVLATKIYSLRKQ